MTRPADSCRSSPCVCCAERFARLVDVRELRDDTAGWIRRRPVLCAGCLRRLKRRDEEKAA